MTGRGIGGLLKAALDYGITVPGLLLLSPLLLVIAIAVKLDSPGPVFYRRRVLGVGGRQFDALKFRTMAANGDEVLAAHPQLREEWARTQKVKADPRVTRLGRTLRRFSLDELPQLINVVRGDMSLVGPRMITPGELALYGEHGDMLLTVRPGLSGLWQVSGRADLPMAERVRLDMQYIREWSVWLDLRILLRTPWAVIGGRGAY